MKYVCPECGSCEVVCEVECMIDPNTKSFEGYVDGHADGAIDNRSFNDSCNDCGWRQEGDHDRLEEVSTIDDERIVEEDCIASEDITDAHVDAVYNKTASEMFHKFYDFCLGNGIEPEQIVKDYGEMILITNQDGQ